VVNIYNADPKNTLQSAVDGLKWYDGKLYAAPMDISSHFLYYRKDLMEKLLSDAAWQEAYKRISKEQMGVEMTPKAVEEWTWDDYLAASYFFTKQYNPDSPTEFGNFTHGKVMGPTAFLWTNAYWGYGGDWFDADGKPTFNNEAATQATNLWKTFFEKGLTPPSSVNGEYPECNEAMKAGQVALAIHWNAAFNELNAADSPVKDMWAVTAPPAGPEGKFTYNHTLAVSLNIDSAMTISPIASRRRFSRSSSTRTLLAGPRGAAALWEPAAAGAGAAAGGASAAAAVAGEGVETDTTSERMVSIDENTTSNP
jgi:multiple sugar transport system substrate-binding protein